MSDVENSRPRRANVNTHPGQIILDSRQKRRTTTEKAAADEAKATKEKEEAIKAQKNRHAVVTRIAELEDAMQREDKAYPVIVSDESDARKSQKTAKPTHDDREMETGDSEAEGVALKANRRSESRNDSDVPRSDSESPDGHQTEPLDVDDDDDCDSDNEYQNDSDPIEEGSKTTDDGSVHSDSGLEESVHRERGKGTRKGASGNTDKRKKKTKASTRGAKHKLREEVTQVRKTSAVSSQKRKPEPEPIENSDQSEDEENRCARQPQKKAKKQKGGETMTASGLRKDWRKLVGHSGSRSNSKKTVFNASLTRDPSLATRPTQPPTNVDADDDRVTVASEVSLSRPSSRASAWSRTRSTSEGLDSVRDLWPPGTFDDDEVPSSLQAARTAKTTKASRIATGSTGANSRHQTGARPSASYASNRTTAMVGPVVKKRDVSTAAGLTRGFIIKSESGELSKPYRHLKVSDIPITGDYELVQWDLVVRGVLDWAGTLSDTFGTNEHPDLLDTVQGLWDKCLPERTEDVHNNPAVKKVIIDRLNEWRSALGKKAVTIISDYIKNDAALRRDSGKVANFVSTLLPYPDEQPVVFPLVYSDPEVHVSVHSFHESVDIRASKALKGSWLAPLLLQVLAVHLRRVTKAPTTFGYPTGALALSTAALERALTLFKTGINIRDEKTANHTGHAFDNKPWGGIACQYAQSTQELPKRKWEQIIRAASMYLAERCGGSLNKETQATSVGTDGRSRIVVSDFDDDEMDIQGVTDDEN